MGSYYQEVEEIVLAEIRSYGSCTVPLLLKRKPTDPEKKSNVQPPKDMRLSGQREVHYIPTRTLNAKGREYCKYHNSFNHSTKSCWAFKNVLQERINKRVLKFPEKQESAVDNDPLLPAASINVNVTDLRDLLNKRRGKCHVRRDENIKSCWILRGQIYEGPRRCDDRRYSRGVGSSTTFRPKSQQFFGAPMRSNQWSTWESSHHRPQRSLGNKDLSEIESRSLELKN